MLKILAYNPDDRVSARQALRHSYFRELRHSEQAERRSAKAQELAERADRAEKQQATGEEKPSASRPPKDGRSVGGQVQLPQILGRSHVGR